MLHSKIVRLLVDHWPDFVEFVSEVSPGAVVVQDGG